MPEDAGFVPPDKVAARCSRSVVTLATKLAASIMKCHQRQGAAALAGTPFGEESCEAAAAAKYDGGIAKLTAAGTCPACIAGNAAALRDGLGVTLDGLNGLAYCAGSLPLP